jgi:GntR family transcriptional repressor for pyruvate dehydrogenase complex
VKPVDSSSRPDEDKGDLLTKITVGRASTDIVNQIRLLMRSHQLAVGDQLPSERELCHYFGVSRVTVRDGLRVLESQGLVQIRVGSAGGPVVTSPTRRHLGEIITDLITVSSFDAAEITEARFVLELEIAPLVCERARDEDIASLYDICEQAEEARRNQDHRHSLSAEWHQRYARATQNRAVTMLVESLHGSLTGSRCAPALHRHEGLAEHHAIVDAIAARDVDRTRAEVAEHIQKAGARLGGGGVQPGVRLRA